jgi:hypothetical protein
MSAMPDEGEAAPTDRGSGRPGGRLRDGTERALTASLWLALLPVVFLVLSALASFIGSLLLEFDLFLIGATALISGLGFYELFIGDIRVGGRDLMPGWLAMHDLNELKSRVVSMIVLVLAVTFAEEAVASPKPLDLLEFGGGVTAVIIALAVFLRWGNHSGASD